MSYVEEFCEEIAIINKGGIVLSGNLIIYSLNFISYITLLMLNYS